MFTSLTEYNNYRINLNCCIAKKAVELSNLLSTGDPCAEVKSQELFLLNAYNEILCNYKPEIITEECTSTYRTSNFSRSLNKSNSLNDNTTLTLYVNNISIAQIITSGLTYIAVNDLLEVSNLNYIIQDDRDFITYTLMLPCNIDNVYVNVQYTNTEGIIVSTNVNMPLVQEGECGEGLICTETIVESIGCLSEDSYEKIINNINSLCGFCNCNQ